VLSSSLVFELGKFVWLGALECLEPVENKITQLKTQFFFLMTLKVTNMATIWLCRKAKIT